MRGLQDHPLTALIPSAESMTSAIAKRPPLGETDGNDVKRPRAHAQVEERSNRPLDGEKNLVNHRHIHSPPESCPSFACLSFILSVASRISAKKFWCNINMSAKTIQRLHAFILTAASRFLASKLWQNINIIIIEGIISMPYTYRAEPGIPQMTGWDPTVLSLMGLQ